MSRRIVLGDSDDPASADARMSILLYDDGDHDDGDLHDGTRVTDRLVLLVHGRSGSADAPHLRQLAQPYLDAGYQVAAPDCPGSNWNDSAGDDRDFTIDRLVRDAGRALSALIAAPRAAGWSGAGLALAGHSMGAYAVARLAATPGPGAPLPRHLLLSSPFTSGIRQLTARARYHPDGLAVLARELPGAIEDWPRHDVFAFSDRLDLPIGVVAGALDTIAPLENVRELVLRLRERPAFLVLPDASHCLEGSDHHRDLAKLLAMLERAADRIRPLS